MYVAATLLYIYYNAARTYGYIPLMNGTSSNVSNTKLKPSEGM